MTKATAETETELGAVINRVRRTKKRVALSFKGKPAVGVVPLEDLEFLEMMEAREEAEDIKACKAAAKNKKSDLIPWSKVKKELGYD